ncbi:M48 family metallopeptidase [bacterium]|nr:M48 family metallopeptidase [bacterium]MBU1434529.1 M48 family metallopeptidase [bacterium]MBU1502107.1 M48 family metallopeptidase [bacterium]
MNEIVFKEFRIEHVLNTKLKNSYLSIKPDRQNAELAAKIILKTPKVSQKFIDELLLNRESWIRKQLVKFQETKSRNINLEDEVLIFGEIYSIDSEEAFWLRERLMKIAIDDTVKIIQAYQAFYLELAKQYLPQRVDFFAKIMGLEYSEIKFKKLKSRWGSCDSKKVITLNTQLLKVKKELIDYVVVHELAHIRYMNHSKEFHLHVDKYLPHSQNLRKILKNTHL